jgi:hypothetical protein
VLAFAGFNSSTNGFKFVVQDMVGWMLCYNCTKFLNFTILQTKSAINLTHEAKNLPTWSLCEGHGWSLLGSVPQVCSYDGNDALPL